MKISVVIPAYNEERYIGACLEALSRQSRPADEIIVVDNNSTDQTAAIVSSFKNVRLITEHQQGMAHARNAGYNAARGDIIARTDADCRPPPDWVLKIEQRFADVGVEAITGPTTFYDFSIPCTNQLICAAEIVYDSIGYVLTYGPNHALRKTTWKKIGANTCTDDQRFHEDADLGYHLHESGCTTIVAYDLINYTSARRLKRNPFEIFVDYPRRIEYTLKKHDPTTPLRFTALYKALLPHRAK